MRFDIDGLRGAALGARQAGGNRAAQDEKTGRSKMRRPADAGKGGEIVRGGGVTAGQTARAALPFRQFDQSGHPRSCRFVRRHAALAGCKAETAVPLGQSRNTGQHKRRQRERSQEGAAVKPLLKSC
jgi:hypothetical protein